MSRGSLLASLTIALLLAGPAAAQDAAVATVLQDRVESLRGEGGAMVRGVALQSSTVLPGFYERRAYQPAWTAPGRVNALIEAIRASGEDGLEPRDYLLDPLQELAREASAPDPPAGVRADLDLLATESLIRLWSSLTVGKVDPARLDTTWHLPPTRLPPAPDSILEALLASDTLARAVAALAPRHPLYVRLRGELARLRAIHSAGGWPAIAEGQRLRVGMTDARVPALRRRLVLGGDLPPDGAADSGGVFSPALARAVAGFQARTGLVSDGVLGPRTVAELNVPVTARINTLRANLERGRWVLAGLGRRFVAVNIAGFQAYYMVRDSVVWSGRAIVGQPARQTPEFRATLTHLILNPTWTVPPLILDEDVLPAVRRDPGYLDRNAMRVLDRAESVIDPATIRWARYDGRSFPYRIVQSPGGSNPLGRIKFVFPNSHAVYLHDTPVGALFRKPQRTFSSGCIRIEQPMALAELLLGDPAWTAPALDSIAALGQETTLPLRMPVTVLVLYWTAWVPPQGVPNFRPDVYGRDAALLTALDAPFSFHGAAP